MKNKYALNVKVHKSKIMSIAEKLYENKDKLVNKLIRWETFTTDFLLLTLPTEEVEHLQWINRRRVWVDAINKQLLKNEYACQLYVIFGLGVQLLTNGNVITQSMSKRTKKIANTFNTTIEMCEMLKGAYPEAFKEIESFQKMNEEALYGLYGRISNSRKIPSAAKRELLNELKKALPPSED